MEWWNSVVKWVGSLTASEWAAIGTVGTMVIAAFAAVFAYLQVSQARRLRIEQARPYVAAYLELGNDIDVTFIQLVVKNFGSTTARNVKVTSNKPMKRAWGRANDPEELLLFDTLPVLVPGQSWRTLFDWGPDRFKAELDDTYTLTVSSCDSAGKPLKDEVFVLDWNTFKPTRNVGVKTIHDLGKSLAQIESTLGRWTEGRRGLSVIARDGQRKDAQDAADEVERQRLFEEDQKIRKREVIEEVADMSASAVTQRFAGEEEELSSYPEAPVPGPGVVKEEVTSASPQ